MDRLVSRFKRAVSLRYRVDVIHECRSCGTTVDDDTDICPECGANEIARYHIE